jgi:hypothetical protein
MTRGPRLREVVSVLEQNEKLGKKRKPGGGKTPKSELK